MRFLKCALFLVLVLIPEPTPASEEDTVRTWARTVGDEIWRLSEVLTKSDQIRNKYKQMNASVKQKDGTQILESALRSVSTMLTRKINAVKCIHATAEELASNFNYSSTQDLLYPFKYCSAKYSNFTDAETDKLISPKDFEELPKFAQNNTHYEEVRIESDSHFYSISVNTNTSCVHVPTNIFYKEKDALNAILWSKGLDNIFTKNYKSDPSLAWQYFGSAHGILRFYPGMPWRTKDVDTYDCRVQSWYIEAATCSKDVIILFDISGSMTGFKNYVARRTLHDLLDTLSNNDYVNVYKFNDETTLVVSCFEGLVQATRENLETINTILEPVQGRKNVVLEKNANMSLAYIKAFKELKNRRECNVTSTQGCNQMVMVITDYVPSNLSEVFDEYNRVTVSGKTYTPVRVFTYLIGKEVTNVREIQDMACSNRGYFVHIHSVEEVQQQVLKYINVIARPMILEGDIPLPTWTHANIDKTRTSKWGVSKDINRPDEDKLVTSVAIPAFNKNALLSEENENLLLGVAGTDVPIDSIAQLAMPHQLGVNGYSFIVSNNGYVLLHPLLITTINGKLQDNYNSVDFVEVEQVDDGKGPRELGDQIKELRRQLVNRLDGNMKQVKVLYHYDQMRRIARVSHDYFFNDLEGTPFSMGISLPKGYGDTELHLKDNPLEAKQGKDLTGINVTDYFRTSFRVHPDWVYCKYHYLEGHEAATAEQEIWRFLVLLSEAKIDITRKQYSEEAESTTFDMKKHCGNETEARDKDDYYCNEDLVKQLVFDAKLTTPYFKTWIATEEEKALAKEYNVTVRFIAAASGMTRWHYISENDKNEKVDNNGVRVKRYNGSDIAFGDRYHNTIEETWYKAAVLQHMINKESLVIASRLPILDDIIETKSLVQNEDGSITLTASYAIFYKDGDSETPASVVGFEFSYKQFLERFLKLTSKRRGIEGLSCNSTEFDCYVVDSSGYVILSREAKDIGKFFGTIHKFVLQALIDQKIFEHVEVFNYQARCPLSTLKPTNNSWSLLTPFSLVRRLLEWIITELVLYMSNPYGWDARAGAAPYETENDDYSELITEDRTEEPSTPPPPVKPKNISEKEETGPPFSCDHQIQLYILNQAYFLNTTGAVPVVYGQSDDCNPRFWATIITKTNLLLVVIDRDWEWPGNYSCVEPPDTKPVPTKDSTDSRLPCHKLELGGLERSRLEGCYTYHEKESEIHDCGLGHTLRGNIAVIVTSALLTSFVTRLLM